MRLKEITYLLINYIGHLIYGTLLIINCNNTTTKYTFPNKIFIAVVHRPEVKSLKLSAFIFLFYF